MDESTTKEIKMESLAEYEMSEENEGVPAWAVEMFGKMKDEICAEVHAKVAYTVRIMLNQLRDDLQEHFTKLEVQSPPSNGDCFCKDINKCKEKLATLLPAQKAAQKEEKKQAKRLMKENKKMNKILRKFSQLDAADLSDNENIDAGVFHVPLKLNTTMGGIHPSKIYSSKYSSNPSAVVAAADSTCQNQEKEETSIGSRNLETENEELTEVVVNSPQDVTSLSMVNVLPKDIKIMNKDDSSLVEAYHSPSDSEFEVISMPPNINLMSEYPRSLPLESTSMISDLDDSSSSSSNDECETDFEFQDCKQVTTEGKVQPQVIDTLEPIKELEPVTKSSPSLMSSTSTILDDYISSFSNEGAVAVEPSAVVSVQIERQRSPYSIQQKDVETINRQEIVHTEPLPSEFLRDRKPYSHTPVDREAMEPKTPVRQAQKEQQHNSTGSRSQRDSTYRVDNLPESFLDEALTFAAQTYNAAKVAVENLADTFVPGSEKVGGTASRPTSSAASSFSSTQRNSPVRSQPTGLSPNEQKLFEMGFLDRGLNSTLLARHNGDLDRVITELINQ